MNMTSTAEPREATEPAETRILVWDVPVRLFHLGFAGAFLGAFAIAQITDDESPIFRLHMLLGGAMVFMVLMRVVWGLVGPKHARFTSFLYGPGAILEYARGVLAGGGKRYVGHNPGSSVAIFAMLALALGLGVSGALMSRAELFEEVHEVLAYAMAAVVAVHVIGVAVHTVQHGENLAQSMLDGRKTGEPEAAIRSAHTVLGLVFLALTVAWSWGLVRGYDANAGTVVLPIVGQTLQLGEAEGHGGARHDHDDDD